MSKCVEIVVKEGIKMKEEPNEIDYHNVEIKNEIEIFEEPIVFKRHMEENSKPHQTIIETKNPYQCTQCDKAFATKTNFEVHLRTHTGVKPYQCNQCFKAFSRSDILKIHMRIHTGEKPYQCNHCYKTFSEKFYLKKHLRAHTEEKSYQCNQCGRAFPHRSGRKTHMRTHQTIIEINNPHQFTKCDKIFASKGYLEAQEEPNERVYHNVEIKYEIENIEEPIVFKRHMEENSKPHQTIIENKNQYQCTQCNKAFATKTQFEVHLRTHTGEKPYQCNQCYKAFSQRQNLKIHMRTHTGEKPYQCNQCFKTFAQKCHLEAHLRTHTGEKSYQCNQCYKTFSENSKLTRHLRTHT